MAGKKRPLLLFVLEAAIDRILKKSARPPLSTTPYGDGRPRATEARRQRLRASLSKGSGGGLEPSATHASTALEEARPPSGIEVRGVARTRRGARRSCARCLRLLAERRRVRHSHALRPIWLASFVAAFSPPVARSPDCWRGGAPSTSGVTEPPDSGREHAPIAAVGRRKKLERKLGLTEK